MRVRFWFVAAFLVGCVLVLYSCGKPETTTNTAQDAGTSSPPDASGPTDKTDVLPDTNAPESDGSTQAPCIPSRSIWDKLVQSLVTRYCGQCHGEKPNFGAPNSLLDYDTLLKGESGSRLVDRMVARMANKTMPPANSGGVEHNHLDTMVEWGSCGTVHPDHSIGMTATLPVYNSPKEAPKDTESFDLLARNRKFEEGTKFAVGEDVIDLYQCFYFKASNFIKEDRFIRRIQVVVDESRVLHHIVVSRDQGTREWTGNCGDQQGELGRMYAWAPGTSAFEFPEGSGLRIRPNDRFSVQIHYNNGAGLKGIEDASGIRFFHTQPQPTEYIMLSPGAPEQFKIPDGETKSQVGTYTATRDFKMLAGMPHMHQIGYEFNQRILRTDGSVVDMIKITNWSFESQFFYHFPFELKQGDKIETTCTWKNTLGKDVKKGPGTDDEMCYNFVYATVSSTPSQPTTTPCSEDPELKQRPKATGDYPEGQLPQLKGGAIPNGTWVLKKLQVYLGSLLSRTISPKTSTVASAKGHLKLKGEQIRIDVEATLMLNGKSLYQENLSVGGSIQSNTSGVIKLNVDCGSLENNTFTYQGDEKSLQVLIAKKTKSGQTYHVLYSFSPAS